MPKDEFDFEDPLELNGVALLTDEDTSAGMSECFAEEFMRMGYNHKQVLALFLNPHYVGPNMVLQNKGELFVRDIIAETFARWGRPIEWSNPGTHPEKDQPSPLPADGTEDQSLPTPAVTKEADDKLTDPLGNPAPKLNL